MFYSNKFAGFHGFVRLRLLLKNMRGFDVKGNNLMALPERV
jgi:hypothetical protein